MNSAHPMLRPSMFHPGASFHESQWSSRTTPTPQEEEASTQKSVGEAGGGFVRSEPQKCAESRECHQSMSVRTPELGVLWTKGDEKKLKEATKWEREGKCERPSGMANQSTYYRFHILLREFLTGRPWFEFQQILCLLGIWSVFVDRFQVKPKYLNSEEKGLVLDSFQGQSRCFARS